jgi:Ca2+-binding EF-hand superfamily protein
MRESFEVLDHTNTGTITAAAVADMLTQLGLPSSPAALTTFFPPHAPAQLNLARYLDGLAGPLTELSSQAELRAAFEAFDVDDSGQVDVGVLREALGREGGMSVGEVESVLGEFTGRRAFGAKERGDVFRYRDFMAKVGGGGDAVKDG